MSAEPSTDALLSPRPQPDFSRRLAHLRVPLGFLGAAAALWLAEPTWLSLAAGAAVSVIGEGLRVWAAGHVEKGREVTKSGPYRWTGHPLYLGSAVIGAGVTVTSRSLWVALLAAVHLGETLVAAIRNEEAGLREKFGREYVDYRSGLVVDELRRFSLSRAVRNREHRAAIGLLVVFILLALKIRLML
ncbi:MAG: isoprenylcysteine carboxylmethyltransferase family protein [Acidobacteria bacterium]|nr:MAG: isoprenylcysteine carboxylmethyltransferase family protein [Acidobacteriota bacterium]